jgi:hypothetical protein
VGTIGVFFTLVRLFMRWLPMVSMTEVKGTMPQADAHRAGASEADEVDHNPAKIIDEEPSGAGDLVAEGAE